MSNIISWQEAEKISEKFLKSFMLWEPSHVGKSIFLREVRRQESTRQNVAMKYVPKIRETQKFIDEIIKYEENEE